MSQNFFLLLNKKLSYMLLFINKHSNFIKFELQDRLLLRAFWTCKIYNRTWTAGPFDHFSTNSFSRTSLFPPWAGFGHELSKPRQFGKTHWLISLNNCISHSITYFILLVKGLKGQLQGLWITCFCFLFGVYGQSDFEDWLELLEYFKKKKETETETWLKSLHLAWRVASSRVK